MKRDHAGHRLAGDDAPRRLLIGCLEDRDPGVDLAQARPCRDQHALGQQPAQPGGMSLKVRYAAYPAGEDLTDRLDGRFMGRRSSIAFLVMAGLVVVSIPLDVCGLRLVLARDWHGAQSVAGRGVQSSAGTGLLGRTHV